MAGVRDRSLCGRLSATLSLCVKFCQCLPPEHNLARFLVLPEAVLHRQVQQRCDQRQGMGQMVHLPVPGRAIEQAASLPQAVRWSGEPFTRGPCCLTLIWPRGAEAVEAGTGRAAGRVISSRGPFRLSSNHGLIWPGRMLSEAKFVKFDMIMSSPRERTR